ncbi:MAG: tetratricopeptide repeat protein [Flavobacteriales bacterium]|nr:tetratricopeptide repeat protein [Flavobacteriales bacterium]
MAGIIRSSILLSTSFLVVCWSACSTGTGPNTVDDPKRPWTLARVDSAILVEPDDAALFARRARLNLARDSVRSAMNDWKRAILLDSTNFRWHLGLGDLYFSKADLVNAEIEFTKARNLALDSTEARFKLAELRLLQRDHVNAMAEVNDALRIDEQNARGYFLKGWIHREAGDTSLAISSYRTAIERDPDLYEAYMALAQLHAGQNDPLAWQYYNSLVDLRPKSVEALYARGLYAQEHGRDSIALADYALIKTLDPNNPTAWYNTGFIYLEHQDRFEAAREEFTGAIERMPTYAQAYYNRGLTYEFEGVLDSAAKDFRVALALMPDFDAPAHGLDRLQKRGLRVLP